MTHPGWQLNVNHLAAVLAQWAGGPLLIEAVWNKCEDSRTLACLSLLVPRWQTKPMKAIRALCGHGQAWADPTAHFRACLQDESFSDWTSAGHQKYVEAAIGE